MEKLWMITNFNIFPILLKGKLLIGFPCMKQLIQQQHGMKYNGFSSIDLVRFVAKDKFHFYQSLGCSL
jgi:hypothetical protein